MVESASVLVRCAACGHNFETRVAGHLTCPTCRSGVWLEPNPELGLLEPAENPPTGEAEKPSEAGEENGTAATLADTDQARGIDSEAAGGERREDGRDQPEASPEDASAESGPPDASPPGDLEMETLRKILEAGPRIRERRLEEVIPVWESGQGGPLKRFWGTIKQVFRGPPRFFAGLKVDSFYKAFSFGWILCTLGVLFFSLYGIWQLDTNYQSNLELLQANPQLEASGIDPVKMLETWRELLVFSLFAAPLIGLVNLWLTAALYHLGVIVVLGQHRGFKATFRATAYGFVPLILLALPLIGQLVGGIWSLVLQVVAIGQVHRAGAGRAAMAILLPVSAILLIFVSIF
jgi:DNA-directed RNA polymerase subunit RPC12/RpoP